ncbi:hypothetical protein [Methylocystis echinoides]|jgi:hypothetical protein|uniref:hypothetical protein n=1 Tax=Methylocystis echinoides TaxID=29468 RepID=UPI00342DEF89
MPSEPPNRISLKTALFIANVFGPATATHYLLRGQLHEESLKDPLPEEFFTLLAKLSAASEKNQSTDDEEGQSDEPNA